MSSLSLTDWQRHRAEFEALGVALPSYDVDKAREAGRAQPEWIHLGAGNLFRAFHAQIADDLLAAGLMDCGVVAADLRSPRGVDEVWEPDGDDVLVVTMLSDGTRGLRVLGSVADALFANPARPEGWRRMRSYFESPELKLVTVTITEKGYATHGANGALLPAVAADMASGPASPASAMGIVASLLLARFEAGAAPLALVTTDNFSQNGKRFRESVLEVARAWAEAGLVPAGFLDYAGDEERVSFPWTMIDRIVPNPSPEIANALAEAGLAGMGLHEGLHLASFANTEEARYLVVEDSFPNGRPSLERAGVIMGDRTCAERADTMKVTACLNPLHTALAVFGCLLGYDRIWKEMEDPELVALVRHLGYDEDLPVVVSPGVIDPRAFLDELIERRLPNSALPDAPQRIASDTSQKVPIRYGHTIAAYLASETLSVDDLVGISLAIAGWLRYLVAVDDDGRPFELSPDPMLDELTAAMEPVTLGQADADTIHAAVSPILANGRIFGCDLYEAGLGGRIEGMLVDMLAGPGAVRGTLERVTQPWK